MNKKIAEATLDRDQRRCQFPVSGRGDRLKKCGDPRVELHHRRTRSQQGKDSEENLIALCGKHHTYVHANPAVGRKTGLLLGTGDSPKRKPWMDRPIPEEGYDG